jgi:hypothetical protein
MKIFLSYSHKDKVLAGRIKHALEHYWLDVFLAHDDIAPSAEWADSILYELKKCDVFLALLSKIFYKSYWTGQEAGIAFVSKKVIISLKAADINPQGFISRFQALKLNVDAVNKVCRRIVRVIGDHQKTGERLKDALIEGFSQSENFIEAAENTDFLLSFDGFTVQQVKEILRATINNYQINNSFKARRMLRSFLTDYGQKKSIGSKLIKRFRESTS